MVAESGTSKLRIPMKIKHKTETRGVQAAFRDVYAPPTLKVFGLVGALTQSGSNANIEVTAGGGMCSNDSRSMC